MMSDKMQHMPIHEQHMVCALTCILRHGPEERGDGPPPQERKALPAEDVEEAVHRAAEGRGGLHPHLDGI